MTGTRSAADLLYEIDCDLRAGLPNEFGTDHPIFASVEKLREKVNELVAAGIYIPKSGRAPGINEPMVRYLGWLQGRLADAFPSTEDPQVIELIKSAHFEIRKIKNAVIPLVRVKATA